MKVFIGIVFSLLSTGYTQQTIPSFVCNGITPGTFVRDVTDCKGWIQCKGSAAPSAGTCPTVYFFDAVKQVCTTEGNVECFTCPPGIANVPVENSCNRFIRCVGGVASERICDEGLAYDQTANNCNIGECSDGTSDGTIVCPNDIVAGDYIATNSPTNCSIGFVCFGDVTPANVTCNEKLHFNTDTLMCVLPEHSTCSVTGNNTTSTTIPSTTSTTTTTTSTTTSTTTTTTPISGPPTDRSSNFKRFLGSYSDYFS